MTASSVPVLLSNFDGGSVFERRRTCNRPVTLFTPVTWTGGLLGVLICVGILLSLPDQAARAQQPSPTFDATQVVIPSSPPLAIVGESIYQQNCAPCHGAQGMGDGPTSPDLTVPATAFADPAAIWNLTPAQLFHTTKFGRIENLMPPWRNELNDNQIWQAVAYAWSLHTTESETTAGAALYAQSCANCHGPQGAGDGPEATGDLASLADPALAISKSQADWLTGWQSAHPEAGGEWTEEERRSVLEYLRTFTYIPPWENAYRPGAGVITGSATQGTPAGTPVAGLTATLEAYAGFTPLTAFTTTINAAGVYTFTNLATDPGINYLVSVSAKGIRYSSAILNFTADSAPLASQVMVYETTDDPSGLAISRLHWIVDTQPGAVMVGEVFSFGNQADRTYTGQPVAEVDAPVTVAMTVPPGAQEITFENGVIGERFRQVGELVYDTTPVLPGADSRQIIMRYLLPHEGKELEFSQTFQYPVGQMTLLIAELPQLEVEIPGFSLASRETFQNQTYQLWSPDGDPPQNITVRMTGLLAEGDVDPRTLPGSTGAVDGAPAAATVVTLLEPWTIWVLSALVIVGAGAGIFWTRRRLGGGASGPVTWQQERAALVAQIATLDDRHALHEIDDATWQRERAQLKARLLLVAQRQQQAVSPPSAAAE